MNSQNRDTYLCRSVTKILTLCRVHEIFLDAIGNVFRFLEIAIASTELASLFWKYHVKGYVESFSMMYLKGGSIFGRSQSKHGLSSKNFFEGHETRSTDFEGDWDPQVSAFFTCSPKIFRWAISGVNIAFFRFVATYSRFWCCVNIAFFCFLAPYSRFWCCNHISRVPPCESWRPEDSENVKDNGPKRFWTGVMGGFQVFRWKPRGLKTVFEG